MARMRGNSARKKRKACRTATLRSNRKARRGIEMVLVRSGFLQWQRYVLSQLFL
jgi:hypothetical protein